MTEWYPSFYWSHWRSSSGAEVHGIEVEPDKFNILSFLATAQALQISFLPVVWDPSRKVLGTGVTSRVHQALVNLDTSFAFKIYHERNRTVEQVFQTLINEITVLSQVFIREHANIAQLQGICWDISPESDRPWPVLVFEKSHFDDLYLFATNKGRGIGFDDRLELCVDIGRAIMAMHHNQIIHGDIKPENVLIFKAKSAKYSAKVIDFGYSTRYIQHEQQLALSRTEPWNAPENNVHKRGWTFSEALKADLFSFGVLCLWLLFETRFSRTVPLSQSLEREDFVSPGSLEENLHRKKSELHTFSQQLLKSEKHLEHDKKMILSEFFDSSLSQDPEKREISLSRFLEKLDPQWTILQGGVPMKPEDNIRSNDFKIERSIYDLYRSDYRVRSYIAHYLVENYTLSPSLATQAALCYHIGFGVMRDEAKSKEILDRSHQNIQEANEVIASLGWGRSEFLASTISELTVTGSIAWSYFVYNYLERRRLDEAEMQLTREKDALIVTCGNDHVLTNLSRDMLARIYSIQGRLEKVEELFEEVVANHKTMLGDDHPDTLTSVANLAWTYRNQGRWEEAERLEVQLLEVFRMKPGSDCSDRLTSMMANLASTYRNQGRWKEAEDLFRQVVETRTTKLGPDHPDTLTSMHNMALTFWNQGQWEKAEKLFREVKENYQTRLGPHHPHTLTSMDMLAATFRNQGRWEEAENQFKQVAETRKRILGEDHLDTLTSLNNLASTIWNQRRWKEAEKLFRQVIETRVTKLGPDHPDTLMSMNNLALTLWNQGQQEDSEKLFIQVIDTRKRKLGKDHPDTLTSINNLASILNQERLKEAENLLVQVTENLKLKAGQNHPSTLTSKLNLAVNWKRQNRHADALELMKDCLQARQEVLGTEHPETLQALVMVREWSG